MRYPKRSQYKYAKSRYRVLNWGAYDTGAVYEAARARRSRSLVGHRIEVSLACKILNTMTGMGMPDSVRVR